MGGVGRGLDLSRRLFEVRGRALLQHLGLLDVCAVACIGSTSQNARLDDEWSRDHMWGPHLYFIMRGAAFEDCAAVLNDAVVAMPDEVDGLQWVGYDGPEPRKTGVKEANALLCQVTGLERPPADELEWMRIVERTGFLGRRWTEQLFDAGQGAVFYGVWFDEMWRDWTRFVPPNVKLSMVSRSVFRIWNSGPEYNLKRLIGRADSVGVNLCKARYIDDVMELAFTLSNQFTPSFKWRAAHFNRLSILTEQTKQDLRTLAGETDVEGIISAAESVAIEIKELLRAQFDPKCDPGAPLSMYAQALRRSISTQAVRDLTVLDWKVDLAS